MIDERDLCRAMREAVELRRKRPVYKNPDEVKQEDAVYDLFRSTAPRFERISEGTVIDRPVDIRFRSRWRMHRLLNRRAGTGWRADWSIQTLIDWIIENWDTVIRVLLSLILIII